MHDTTPAVRRMVRERSLALSGGRRMIQAAEMFDTARAFVLASLPEGLTGREQRLRLCARLYGTEFAWAIAEVQSENLNLPVEG